MMKMPQISLCSNICRTMKIIYSKYQSTEGDNNQILISCLWACMFKKFLSCFWFRPRNQYSADKKLNKKEMFYMNWLLCGNLGQNATKKQNKNLIQIQIHSTTTLRVALFRLRIAVNKKRCAKNHHKRRNKLHTDLQTQTAVVFNRFYRSNMWNIFRALKT